jgi:hypothetical protein
MTTMSTKIDDLPGPIPINIRDDLTKIQNEISTQSQSPEIIQGNQSNITMGIKKKVQFKDEKETINSKIEEPKTLFSFIQSQITEENLLLLIVLMIASRTELDRYMIQLPVFGQTLLNSNILLTIAKAMIILILYIIIKLFVLPNIN